MAGAQSASQLAAAMPVLPGRDTADLDVLAHARRILLAPIGGASLVDQTVKRLTDMIALGLAEVGEQLPAEPILAERLGVSPATLREALAVLRGNGLLETRRGRGGGTVVRREVSPPPPDKARRQLAARTIDDIRDLGDFRLAVSGRAAALAAQRATPTEIGLLTDMAGQLRIAESTPAYGRLDSRLHIAIAGTARSSWLTQGQTTAQAELCEYLALLVASPAHVEMAEVQHRGIVEAIAGRDARTATEAAEQHERTVTALLIEARSELANTESERTADYFAGLRPFGSELGTTSLEVLADEAAMGRRDKRPDGPARDDR
jgi:GntR family transcriptional regulator, transcriptional repressor for pyruvate dehydrogenase complex